jgi:hypothetical protein
MPRDRSYPRIFPENQLIALMPFITSANSFGLQSDELNARQRAISNSISRTRASQICVSLAVSSEAICVARGVLWIECRADPRPAASQSVETPAQIRHTGGKPHPPAGRQRDQRADSTSMTRAKVARSTSPSTRTQTRPPDSSLITPHGSRGSRSRRRLVGSDSVGTTVGVVICTGGRGGNRRTLDFRLHGRLRVMLANRLPASWALGIIDSRPLVYRLRGRRRAWFW